MVALIETEVKVSFVPEAAAVTPMPWRSVSPLIAVATPGQVVAGEDYVVDGFRAARQTAIEDGEGDNISSGFGAGDDEVLHLAFGGSPKLLPVSKY